MKNNNLNSEIENDEDFDDAIENLIYSMRVHAEFYGYPRLMEMVKEYAASSNKEKYIESIDLNINPELQKELSITPSAEVMEMIFEWLSTLDVDFLVGVAKLIKDEQTATLFEGMIYMGLSVDELEDEEESE